VLALSTHLSIYPAPLLFLPYFSFATVESRASQQRDDNNRNHREFGGILSHCSIVARRLRRSARNTPPAEAMRSNYLLLTVREIGSDNTPVPETLARTGRSLTGFVSTAKQITLKPRPFNPADRNVYAPPLRFPSKSNRPITRAGECTTEIRGGRESCRHHSERVRYGRKINASARRSVARHNYCFPRRCTRILPAIPERVPIA